MAISTAKLTREDTISWQNWLNGNKHYLDGITLSENFITDFLALEKEKIIIPALKNHV